MLMRENAMMIVVRRPNRDRKPMPHPLYCTNFFSHLSYTVLPSPSHS